MKPKRRWLRWLKWPAILIVCWATVIPSLHAFLLRHQIVVAFETARSVRLEEFLPGELKGTASSGTVLNMVELSTERKKAVVAAIPMTPDIGMPGFMPLCYMPHHRVVMTKPDGREVAFEICFGCDEVSFAQGKIVTTPFLWRSSLRRLFTTHGISVRTREEYLSLQFPDLKH